MTNSENFVESVEICRAFGR